MRDSLPWVPKNNLPMILNKVLEEIKAIENFKSVSYIDIRLSKNYIELAIYMNYSEDEQGKMIHLYHKAIQDIKSEILTENVEVNTFNNKILVNIKAKGL